MRELRRKTQGVIEELSWPRKHGDAQSVLHNMVATYLVHHGYSQTAESFAKSAGQEISEELTSMRNRQHIQKLVLAGKLGDAITTVEELYPGLLHLHQDLHFKLKVRQFIEMVSGADSLDTEIGGKWADTSSSSSSGHSSGHMDMEHDNNSTGVNGTSDNNLDNAAASNGNM